MKIEQIAARRNLTLAWRRITTGANQQYKRYFRHIYYAYEVALEKNLADLSQRLTGGSFRPRTSFRIYMPKPSGLQRPITLLHLDDQIVLQGIANIVARRLHERRAPLQKQHVFSNILQQSDSVFFFRDWRSTYRAFTRKIEQYFTSGRRWVADFDLAAFYDTISHDLLLRTVYPKLIDGEDLRLVRSWLAEWTAEGRQSLHGHGIPQGPIASDLLAECFLLPIDEKLASTTTYARYVDDIRLFGKTEKEVRESVIRLEILCRDRGLIPQVGKFAIKEASSIADAIGMLPSITPPGDQGSILEIPEPKAVDWLKSSLTRDGTEVQDKTRARYVLYRAGRSKRILDIVLRLLQRHPEHTDAFVYHLSQYPRSRRVAVAALAVLAASPYEYVRGEMWHLLARLFALLRSQEISTLITLGVAGAKKSSGTTFSQRWGICHFLCRADSAGLGNYRNFLQFQPQLLQALSVPFLPESAFANGGLVRHFLIRSSFEAGVALAPQMSALGKRLADFRVLETDVPSQTLNVFAVWGLVKTKGKRIDPMGEILSRRYAATSWNGWKDFLGVDYPHGLGLLKQAEALFDAGRSQWLSYQNSFNQVLFVRLQDYLKANNRPGYVATKLSNGEMQKYGITLDPGNKFSTTYPKIGDTFREMNRRRNKLPGSHPFDEKTAAQTRHLSVQERNKFVNGLRVAYEELRGLVS